MEQILSEVYKISLELKELKEKLERYEADKTFEDWIPRKKLMIFLEYGETQMCALLKSGDLKVTEIGNRKFINRQSILLLLEKKVKA